MRFLAPVTAALALAGAVTVGTLIHTTLLSLIL